MKRIVWLTVHGEQQYEGMSADSSDLRVRGTMEETCDGYLLRYEETDGEGKVTTATRLALAPDCVILTRTGEVTSEMAFAEGAWIPPRPPEGPSGPFPAWLPFFYAPLPEGLPGRLL